MYRVDCTHPTKGSASDFVKVTAVAAALPPTITVEPMIVRYGEATKISWDTGTSDPAECSTTGAGFIRESLRNPQSSITLSVAAETVFTISCPLGSDSVTVKVLPRIQES
jgi:hypothetical protein